MTETALATALGIDPRTIRNAKKNGFIPVRTGDGHVDIETSIKAFVKYQSGVIRELSIQNSRRKEGNSHSDDYAENQEIDWKQEKEKQAAIKIRLANQQTMGELIPSEALIELFNSPLTLFRTKLMGLSNEISKRAQIDPATGKLIDEVVRGELQRLNEKGADELQEVIRKVIERYSEHYSSTDEDGDY